MSDPMLLAASGIQKIFGLLSFFYLMYLLIWALQKFKPSWPTALISKFFLPVFLIFLSATAFALLAKKEAPRAKRNMPPENLIVHAEKVEYKTWSPNIQGYGNVISKEPLPLFAEVSGILEEGEIDFLPGKTFSKGQVIAKIDSRQADLQYKSAVSELLSALAIFLPEIKSDLPEQYIEYKKYFDEISFEKLPDLPKEKTSQEKLYLSRYNIYRLHFNAKSREIALSKHYLRAPFSGTLDKVQFSVGSAVSPGMNLASLVNTRDLEIEAAIPMVDAKWLTKGGNVILRIDGADKPMVSKVSRVSKVIDEGNQAVRVYIEIPKNHAEKFLDGMFVNLELEGVAIENSLKLPRQSVGLGGEVFQIKNSKLIPQKMDVVRLDLNHAYLRGNIPEGDTILAQNLPTAISGMKVTASIGAKEHTNP